MSCGSGVHRAFGLGMWPGRGNGRTRGAKHGESGETSSAVFPTFQACPVAVDDMETGFGADLSVLPTARSLARDDSFGLDSLLASAEKFITMFHGENRAGPPDLRLRQVRREIATAGTYWHTPDELEFGARVAWRNSSRCIGRLYWRSLRVRDRRDVTAACDIAAESVAHLQEATNGGRIRPVITVFAPDAPDQPGPRIVNSQLVRYAGYEADHGGVTGDPANTGITRLARDLGWPGGRPAGRFDILPLLVREAGAPVTLHELPADAVLEVTIGHPGDQRHVPGDWGRLLPSRAVQRLVHVHGDRIARPGRHGSLRPASGHRRAHGPIDGQRPDPVERQGDDRAQPRGLALVQHRRGDDRRSSHRVGPLSPAPGAGGAARPGVPGGLDLDCATRRIVRDTGLPPVLPGLRPVTELLPPPAARDTERRPGGMRTL